MTDKDELSSIVYKRKRVKPIWMRETKSDESVQRHPKNRHSILQNLKCNFYSTSISLRVKFCSNRRRSEIIVFSRRQ